MSDRAALPRQLAPLIHRLTPAARRIADVARRPVTLSRVALASVVANVIIVGTGGAVRLTGSGLGCPTWPQCTAGSYTPTAPLGVHGVIEYANRTLTFAVALIAVAGVAVAYAQRRRRPAALGPAVGVLAGIPAQAVIGGITVLTHLNPWVVGLHFLASMAVIAAAYTFWRRTVDRPVTRTVGAPLRHLATVLTIVCGLVLVLGTAVTGSGPHAGDAHARRNGLDPRMIAQLHTDAVMLLLGLSVALWLTLRAVDAVAATRAAALLVAAELAQGVVGAVQYAAHLPAGLVGLHMIGASLVWLASVAVLSAAWQRGGTPAVAVPVPAQQPSPARVAPR